RSVRLPCRTGAPQDRRRIPGVYRISVERDVSALPAAHPLHVDRPVSRGSGAGDAPGGVETGTRFGVEFEAAAGCSLQVPNLLRRDVLAGRGARSRMEIARPAAASD